jgi:two-component system CitB family sensor kinase
MGVFLLQLGIVALLTAVGTVAAVLAARSAQSGHARSETLALAQTVASSPGIAAAIGGRDPSATLEPVTLRIQHQTGVDFIVVMSPAGIRYTHPNPAQIGKHYLGHIATALAGRSFSEVYRGTLGLSVRSVAPVYGPGGHVVGLVSVGITLHQLSDTIRRELPGFIGIALGAFALVGAGSWAVSRRLRKQTLGLGPQEITRLYEHHDAVLHAMHEGLLVTDSRRRVLLANDEAVRLLGCAADPTEQPAAALALDSALAALLQSGRQAYDETYVAGDRVLAVNQSPARRDGRTLGTVTTLRDHTELRALTGELDSTKSFADALSAAAHESANRLHTMVMLIELGKPAEAVRFATEELAASQQLIDRLMNAVGNPALAALLLGKISQAAEHGVEVSVSDDTGAPALPTQTRDLITIAGNLIDNAIEAAAAGPTPGCLRRVTVTLRMTGDRLLIRVADSGPGIPAGQTANLFAKGWTTKNEAGHGLGLALVRQSVRRLRGSIEAGRDDELGGAVLSVWLPADGGTAAGAGADGPAGPLSTAGSR